MPELPEVETVKRQLKSQVTQKKITEVGFSKYFLRNKVIDKKGIKKLLIGEQINKIDRRGKYLLMRVSNETTLLIHLGMSGTFQWGSGPKEFSHCHFWMNFEDNKVLCYVDPRRFGQIDLFKNCDEDQYSSLSFLGPEPFEIQEEELKIKLKDSKRKIKDFLLDQKMIAGLGNIYVCEALFLAGIHPEAIASRQVKKSKQLLLAIQQTLNQGIKNCGTSFSDYRDINGFRGLNQNQLSVFLRAEKPCIVCSNKIKRIKQGGRSSFYCSFCQRK